MQDGYANMIQNAKIKHIKNNNTHFAIKKPKKTSTTQGKKPTPTKHAYKTSAHAQSFNMQAKAHQYLMQYTCKPGQRRLPTETHQKPNFLKQKNSQPIFLKQKMDQSDSCGFSSQLRVFLKTLL